MYESSRMGNAELNYNHALYSTFPACFNNNGQNPPVPIKHTPATKKERNVYCTAVITGPTEEFIFFVHLHCV